MYIFHNDGIIKMRERGYNIKIIIKIKIHDYRGYSNMIE
jgi:hypothetical protein